MKRKSRVCLESCKFMQPSVWRGACVDDFIGVETACSAVPKTVQGCPPERGIVLERLHCNHDNQWLVRAGLWGFGRGVPGGGAPAAQCLPMKAIQDHARFFLIAWREEVPKTLSSFQPPRYAILSTAIEQRASPIVFAQHAIQAQSSAIVFAPLSFGSCNWKFNASIYCNPSRLPRS